MRNVKTWGILFLCLLLLPGVAYAQKRQIEGTVISQEDKEPLIGATVIVKGSLSGAETDLDGHFTLEVDPDAKFIIVDYIGMKQTQVSIPKSGILNVALQPEAMNLDEVVVTGYGNFSRSSFTGSANTLRADLLKEMPVVSIEQKLQGMTSGVNITGSSGQPGANASIRKYRFGYTGFVNVHPYPWYGLVQRIERTFVCDRRSSRHLGQPKYRKRIGGLLHEQCQDQHHEHDQSLRYREYHGYQGCRRRLPLRFPCGQRCYLDHDQTRIERTYPGHVER